MAYIRKLKSGNYQVQIRVQGLRPISRSFSKKKDATAFAKQVEGGTELARKLGTPMSISITFRELADQYLAQYSGKDISTKGRIDFWCTQFGKKVVTQIDEYMVDDGLVTLQRKQGRGGRLMTDSTINRYKSTLSAVFIYFIRHPEYKRLGFTNPVRKESVSCFPENPPKNRFLTGDEQQGLLQACRKSTWERLYLIVLMALTTGARKGELLGLRWADVDFRTRTAKLGVTKNGKPRLLPLTRVVIEEMLKFRGQNEHLVFHSTVNKETAFDIKKQWLIVSQVSGLGHCRFHDLRHTAASNLVKAGRTLFEVGTLLGHSSTTMTARYSHLAIHDTQNMVDAVMGGLK